MTRNFCALSTITLGDYRDRNGQWKRRQPMTGQTFITSESGRKRYWARSAIGWPTFSAAEPNAAHYALAELQAKGVSRALVTQNVDGLHQKAGHSDVTDLHGSLATVSCIDCEYTLDRDLFQNQLLLANDWLQSLSADYAPDGDADLEADHLTDLQIPSCRECGGILKPDVVFFGENVPRHRVADALQRLRTADALLVAGSSLMVFSGFRFCRDAAQRGQAIAIVNNGLTRADDLAALKVPGDCGERLTKLAQQYQS